MNDKERLELAGKLLNESGNIITNQHKRLQAIQDNVRQAWSIIETWLPESTPKEESEKLFKCLETIDLLTEASND